VAKEPSHIRLGDNSSVEVGGQKFHVETETRSGDHPIIDTTVYSKGRILYRRVKTCDDLPPASEEIVEELQKRVDAQHHSVMHDLQSGALNFDQSAAEPKRMKPAAPIEFPKGIEVRLANSGSWLVNGTASLNVEVRGRADNKPAAGISVEVVMEGAKPPFRMQAGTDPSGRVALAFPMPKLGVDGGELIIRATSPAGRDELRFRLKPKAREARKVQSS
jgi:hypothetical protein